MAALRGSEQVVGRLIDHGADVQEEYQGTPLEAAATLGHVEVHLVLVAGADVTIRTAPLHMAASFDPLQAESFGRMDVTKLLLLTRGAEINAMTNDGHTPPST